MIALNQIGMAYGQKLLFYDVSLNLNWNKRYALVGANGSGKSTFFRLMNGEEELSTGEILRPKDASLGWLKQDQFRYENTPIKDIVLQGKPELWKALEEKEALFLSDDWDEKKGYRFAVLEETIAHYSGYEADAEIETILRGLGIAPEYLTKPLSALSGGYKLRVLLAQALFQRPSVLLLDEPTNHLDILSIRWLEKFLTTDFKGLLIFISHDMDFIDNVSDYILDLDYGEIHQYGGPYQRFLTEKALIEEQKLIEKKGLELKIAEMQRFVDRFKAKATKAAQARSRVKMIEKIELPDIKKSSRVAPNFHFSPKKVSGKQVVKAKALTKTFGAKHLFKKLDFEVLRGEKVAIMGVNGIGKSTLIKILTGLLGSDEGEVTLGHEVKLSYFSQDHHELLNSSMTVLNWLRDNVAESNEQNLRRVLGQVLFTKDEVDKDILSLSGGEAARLLLAKIMLEQANFLILDEPTNHMDLESIEALGLALKEYSGTLIFVSHNRHFVEKVASRILYFEPGKGVRNFKGAYHEFALTLNG